MGFDYKSKKSNGFDFRTIHVLAFFITIVISRSFEVKLYINCRQEEEHIIHSQ